MFSLVLVRVIEVLTDSVEDKTYSTIWQVQPRSKVSTYRRVGNSFNSIILITLTRGAKAFA